MRTFTNITGAPCGICSHFRDRQAFQVKLGSLEKKGHAHALPLADGERPRRISADQT